ncbi:polysaccharide deacetylase family protein [Bacillus aerolatus]|uniref:Polysaccharide deacetylase family protein n=1 Tax=Bacillus aerolatus TaxID=2653354 RepID=A0A6I1FLD5_9BACI|nr:polysaccharide deacetylase [Bacillus aerolatus]KAB7707039.1 polysaccharide deacetylase family protein [Bacillus aerolatus]
MRKKWMIMCVMMLFFLGVGGASASEVTKKNIYIGLHDKMLPFATGEAFIVNGQAVAPAEKLSRYLYMKQTGSPPKGDYTFEKGDQQLTFNLKTKAAFLNGKATTSAVTYMENGQLYIGIRWLVELFGFKVDYLSNHHTVRVYREAGAKLSNDQFLAANKSFFDRINSRPPTKGPIAYLTFDDGPSVHAASILKTLAAYKVKATFFYIEPNITKHASAAKQTAAEGHYLALHSVTHQVNPLYQSPQNFMNEMAKTNQTMKQVTGHSSVLVRAPFGSSPYLKQPFRDAMAKKGYRLWDWDIDSEDWRYSASSKARILQNIQAGIKQQKKRGDQHVVILLHEKKITADMLPQILQYLKKEGYQLQAYNPSAHIVQNFWKDARL